MALFKINWWHDHNGALSHNESYREFEPTPELSVLEVAELYAESLSSGPYSVSEVKESNSE